ncbi:DDE-type integrase/transposase/recombinase, partial [Dubosiella newyorkensis]|uniref:DDE-type integrase/transposase/recombinase n=1 Tax=Dubosiella newyorkensis TaxID=1862672 RepID=UPI0027308757
VYSYSRFKVFYLSLSRKRDVLLHLLDQAFETAGGVPKALKTDNMKTVMDEPRTARSKGKVNARFEQFAKDYGFETKPCTAGHPWSKGKVENPMKALDELFAYNGKLDLYGLCLILKEINERLNASVHTTTGKIGTMLSLRTI